MKKFITVLLSTAMLLQIFVPLKAYAAVPSISEQLPVILNNIDYFVKVDDNKYLLSEDLYMLEYIEESQCYKSYYSYDDYIDGDNTDTLFLGKAVLNTETDEYTIYYNYGNGWKPTDIEYNPGTYYYDNDETYKNELGESYHIELMIIETSDGVHLDEYFYIGDYNSIGYNYYKYFEYDSINNKVYLCEYYVDDECEDIEDAIKLDRTDETLNVIQCYGEPDPAWYYTFDDSTGTLYILESIFNWKPWSNIDDSQIKNIVINEDVELLHGCYGDYNIDRLVIKNIKTDLSEFIDSNMTFKVLEIQDDNISDSFYIKNSYTEEECDTWHSIVELPYHNYFYQYSWEEPVPLVLSNIAEVSNAPEVQAPDWFIWGDTVGTEFITILNQDKDIANYISHILFGGPGSEYNGRNGNQEWDAHVVYGLNAKLAKDVYYTGNKIPASDLDVNVLALGAGLEESNTGSYWDYESKSWKWIYEKEEEESAPVEYRVPTNDELEDIVRSRFTYRLYLGDRYISTADAYVYDNTGYFKCNYDTRGNASGGVFVGRYKDDGTIEVMHDGVNWISTEYTKSNVDQYGYITEKVIKNNSDKAYNIKVIDNRYIWDSVNKAFYLEYIILNESNKRIEHYDYTDFGYVEPSIAIQDRLEKDSYYREGYTDGFRRLYSSGSTYYYVHEDYYYDFITGNKFEYKGNPVYIADFYNGQVRVFNGSTYVDTGYTTKEDALANDVNKLYHAGGEDVTDDYYPIHVLDSYWRDDKTYDRASQVMEYEFYTNKATYRPVSDYAQRKDGVDTYIKMSFYGNDDNIKYDPYDGYYKTDEGFKYVNPFRNGTYWLCRWTGDYLEVSSDGVSWNRGTLPEGIWGIYTDDLGWEYNGIYYDYRYELQSNGEYMYIKNENADCNENWTYEIETFTNSYNVGDAFTEDNKYYPIDYFSLYPVGSNCKELEYYDGNPIYCTVELTEVNNEWYIDDLTDDEPKYKATDELIVNNVAYLPLEVSLLTSATWNGEEWNLTDDLIVQPGTNTLSLEYNGLVYDITIMGGNNPSGNINFEADINSWFEVKVPNEHNIDKMETQLSVPLKGDLKGNQSMVLSCTPTTTLTDGVTIINAMCSLGKTKYTYDELLQSPDAQVNVIVDKLPAGRYVGQMQLTVGIENNT